MKDKSHRCTKILIVFNTWLTIGGGGIHTLKIAKALGKSSDIRLLIPNLGFDLAEEYLRDVPRSNVSVYTTPLEKKQSRSAYLIYFFRMIKSIVLALKSKGKYDIVISNCQLPFDLLPAIFFKIKNAHARPMLVVYFHHGNPCVRREFSLRNILSRVNFRISIFLSEKFASLVFAINKSIMNYVVNEGLSREKVVVTSNGIDYEEIQKISNRGAEYEYDAVFLGRVDRIKGAYDLLRTWRIVMEKCPEAKLCIIGDGPDRISLENKIRDANLDKHIILVGRKSEEEKYRLMKKSKIFVYPSHQESWGIIIAEAMACGLPVIAFDLPVYEEIFDGHVHAVEFGDVRRMAEKCVDILENYEVYKKSSERAKDFIWRYDWASIQAYELRHIGKNYEKHRN